jgi:hypothetical protein
VLWCTAAQEPVCLHLAIAKQSSESSGVGVYVQATSCIALVSEHTKSRDMHTTCGTCKWQSNVRPTLLVPVLVGMCA